MKLKYKDILFVTIQFGLFGLYVFDLQILPAFIPEYLYWPGIVLTVMGITVLIIALLQLNQNLSPFPTPVEHGQLITTGIYGIIRHPIYCGILIGALGFSLLGQSEFHLMLSLLLWILFSFKVRYEENRLRNKYPEYEEYMKRTGRLFPGIGRLKKPA